MRLRVTLDSLVILDVTLFEPDDDERDAVHDLSVDHPIGFALPPGWHEPREDD